MGAGISFVVLGAFRALGEGLFGYVFKLTCAGSYHRCTPSLGIIENLLFFTGSKPGISSQRL